MMGTVDRDDAHENRVGITFNDYTLNGRPFSSTGLPPLPPWALNNNGTVVEGESAVPSLSHTMDTFHNALNVDLDEEDNDNEAVKIEVDQAEESIHALENEEGEGDVVVVPKPLNDVSNVFFDNDLPLNNEVETLLPEDHFEAEPSGVVQSGQSPSGPLDDSWISNPSVPHFHRLSDLDASDTMQYSLCDTVANITDTPIAETQVHESEEPEGDLIHRETNIEDVDDNKTEQLETIQSQRTPSYHSDDDVETKSPDDVVLSNSKKNLEFHTDESPENSETELKCPDGEKKVEIESIVQFSPRQDRTRDEELIEAENPTRYVIVSRTSHSPSSRSGSSHSSVRKTARYRREYQRHRHGADSSDDNDSDNFVSKSGSVSADKSQKTKSVSEAREQRPTVQRLPSTDSGGYASDHSHVSEGDNGLRKSSGGVGDANRSVLVLQKGMVLLVLPRDLFERI